MLNETDDCLVSICKISKLWTHRLYVIFLFSPVSSQWVPRVLVKWFDYFLHVIWQFLWSVRKSVHICEFNRKVELSNFNSSINDSIRWKHRTSCHMEVNVCALRMLKYLYLFDIFYQYFSIYVLFHCFYTIITLKLFMRVFPFF